MCDINELSKADAVENGRILVCAQIQVGKR